MTWCYSSITLKNLVPKKEKVSSTKPSVKLMQKILNVKKSNYEYKKELIDAVLERHRELVERNTP